MVKAGQFLGGVIAGSIAGAAVGFLMSPRRKRTSLMRQGMKMWSKGSALMKKSRIWH